MQAVPNPVAPDPALAGATIVVVGEVGLRRVDGTATRLRGRQPRLVLAYLAIEGRPVERYELGELLWGERLPDHWAGAVRGVLSKVRAWLGKALGDGARLVAEDGLVTLHLPAGVPTDAALAARAVERAQEAMDVGDLRTAAAHAAGAAQLLEGPFLPYGDGDWVARQRDRVEALVATAAHLEARARLDGGDAQHAAQLAADRVTRDPLDEVAHHLRIEALLAAGRRAEALRALEDLEEVLARELGVSPVPETVALVRRTLRPAADPPDSRDDGRDRDAPADAGGAGRATRAAPAPAPTTPARPAPGGAGPGAAEEADLFVGRDPELARLLATWEATVTTGRPHLAVIQGDAGIGKTRLARELGHRLAGQPQVWWGRCRPETGLAFEPIVEVLAAAVDADPGLLARIGPAAGHLAPLLPHLRLPAAPAPLDAAVERTQLFGAVTTALDELAAGPVAIVVDDLQWASADTLGLVDVVAERLARPLLVVTTYRGRAPLVEAALARLRRTVPTVVVPLRGLGVAELRQVIRHLPPTPDTDEAALAEDLHRRTGGNPYYVTEMAREARRRGTGLDPARLPDRARSWIEHRLAALDPAAAAVLDLCAVIGVEIDLDLLAACASFGGDTLTRACETLLDQGFLVETTDGRGLAFTHLLTRDAVYEHLRSPRRLQLHRTVVRALDAAGDRPGTDALLAHHLARLGPESAARAARHAYAAGQDALARSAVALAARHFALAERLAHQDPAHRARSLIGLGRARYRDRDLAAATEAFDAAIDLARSHELPLELAEASLHLVGRAGRGAATGMTDEQRERLLREALAGLDALEGPGGADGADPDAPRRASLRGQVEGELALALLFTGSLAERQALVARTLDRARAAMPPVPRHLARALLNRRSTLVEPGSVSRRLADADEVLALPPAEVAPEQRIAALAYRHEDLLTLGRHADAATALTALATAVADHPHPYWTWVARTWEALGHQVAGDLAAAEAAAVAASELRVGHTGESSACLGANLASIRLWQGRGGEVLAVVAEAAERFSQVPCYRAVQALCAVQAGDRARAAALYRAFAGEGFVLPADSNRFLTLAVLADVAIALGDVDGARRLHERLAPYAGLQVVLNCYGGGGAWWGAADDHLSRLAALLAGEPAPAPGAAG